MASAKNIGNILAVLKYFPATDMKSFPVNHPSSPEGSLRDPCMELNGNQSILCDYLGLPKSTAKQAHWHKLTWVV